mgnify:CR=1 FL=1
MYQSTKIIFFVLLLSTLTNLSFAAKNNVVKVYDKGVDGGMRIYVIVCPNGKKTTVTQTLNISNENVLQQEAKLLSDAGETDSLQSRTQKIKKKALRMVGQQNRAERCLYPVNSKKQCKSYKDVDAAAQAACNLLN